MPRVDDPDLDDETVLWRRVLPDWITSDDNAGHRPTSITFMDRHTFEVSVSVARLTDSVSVLKDHPADSLVAIKVGDIRRAGGIVGLTPENPDPAHRVLCYANPSQMRKVAKLLTDVNNFNWIILKPPDSSQCAGQG